MVSADEETCFQPVLANELLTQVGIYVEAVICDIRKVERCLAGDALGPLTERSLGVRTASVFEDEVIHGGIDTGAMQIHGA